MNDDVLPVQSRRSSLLLEVCKYAHDEAELLSRLGRTVRSFPWPAVVCGIGHELSRLSRLALWPPSACRVVKTVV